VGHVIIVTTVIFSAQKGLFYLILSKEQEPLISFIAKGAEPVQRFVQEMW
jgi:hypothetical protein